MNQIPVGRSEILDALREGVAKFPWVRAVWSGGSDASGRTDHLSDIDLFVIVEEARIEEAFEALHRILETLSPIEVSWRMPSPTPFGCEQEFLRLRDSEACHMVDLVVMKPGDPEWFLERERHGEPLILLDRDDLARSRPLDREKHLERMRERLPTLTRKFDLFQNLVSKAAARGARADAMHGYLQATLMPLVELLRMRHCPERFDYGLRYLDRDLPPELREVVEGLAFVPSIEELESCRARAQALFDENLRALDAGEWRLE
jgi:predicted nucleotidyltransferase